MILEFRDLEDQVRQVLEGPCAARCMDDKEDREATIKELNKVLTSKGRQTLIDTIHVLAHENKTLNANLTATQARCTELIQELRALKRGETPAPHPRDEQKPDVPRDEEELITNITTLMREKLAKHRSKGGWRDDGMWQLYERLTDEVTELRHALQAYDDALTVGESERLTQQFSHAAQRECADVANFAAMVADVIGENE